MSQPYYESEDDLSPSFKKLCIRNSYSNCWSIVPFKPSNKRTKDTNIKEVVLHKKLKDSRESLIDNHIFKQSTKEELILYTVKPFLLSIEDSTEDDIEEEYEMCLD